MFDAFPQGGPTGFESIRERKLSRVPLENCFLSIVNNVLKKVVLEWPSFECIVHLKREISRATLDKFHS